jgi:hypothetical protein
MTKKSYIIYIFLVCISIFISSILYSIHINQTPKCTDKKTVFLVKERLYEAFEKKTNQVVDNDILKINIINIKTTNYDQNRKLYSCKGSVELIVKGEPHSNDLIDISYRVGLNDDKSIDVILMKN